MKRVAAALALVLFSGVARADGFEQDDQVTFGVTGAYVPAQHDLEADVATIGHYVAYSHRLGFVFVGLRFAAFYGWLPGGGAGQQWVLQPDAFVGLQARLGRVALRLEIGTGPLANGGDGFAATVVDHTYLRGTVQVNVVKSVIVEAFAGPSLVVGSYAVAGYPELGLGAGWNF